MQNKKIIIVITIITGMLLPNFTESLFSLPPIKKYLNWFLISYHLHNKTNRLFTLKKKFEITSLQCCSMPELIFSYLFFTTTIEQTSFDQRLLALKKTWKYWNVSPSYQWAWEYSIILFNLYKTVFDKELYQSKSYNSKLIFKHFSLETFWLYINSVNSQIQSLPLEAILNTIDLLAEAIPIFFANYGIPTQDTWVTWIKDYWWAILLTGVPLIIRILIIFKNSHQITGLSPINPLTGINSTVMIQNEGFYHQINNGLYIKNNDTISGQ